jgi:20S proteasome alpha/beta subunit
MTVAIGFNCTDGIVLCTDSLESDGITKSMVNKIWAYETQDEWGIAVAGAGEADFCESLTDNLRTIFSGAPFDRDRIMLQLRSAINEARTTYPDLEWASLFALFGPNMFDRKLLRLSPGSKHLAPVSKYEAIGIGGHLAKFFCSQLRTVFMNVDEAVELGVFITGLCIEHVDGCDGPISVLSWKIGQKSWFGFHPNQVSAIEKNFGSKTLLRRNLVEFWQSLTPHLSRTVPQYVDESKGGSVSLIHSMLTRGKEVKQRKSK